MPGLERRKPPWWRPIVALTSGPACALIAQAIRLRRMGRRRDRGATPLSRLAHRAPPAARVIVLGDSTGVGVGARPHESIAGLLAADHPDVEIVNRCRVGATLVDVARQVPPGTDRFDLALVLAGGNDVLRATGPARWSADAHTALANASRCADRVIWLGPADIGTVPLFLPPFSWWLSSRTARACATFRVVAHRHRSDFVDFCAGPQARGLAALGPARFAADGIHPSATAYRYCYEAMRRACDLSTIGGAARH